MNNEKKIKNIFKKNFKVTDKDLIKLDHKNIIWDSINHINLVLEIEDTFNIKIQNNHIGKINSYNSAKLILSKHYHINF